MNSGALLSLADASTSFSRSSPERKPLRNLLASIRPCEQSMRWANSSRAISRLTNSVGTLASMATYSAMFVARAVLPMLGRAARTTNSESCSPPVRLSRSCEAGGHAHALAVLQPGVDAVERLDQQVVDVGDLVGAALVVDGEDLLFGLADHLARIERRLVGVAEDFGAGVDQRAQRGLVADDLGVVDGVGGVRAPTGRPRPDRPAPPIGLQIARLLAAARPAAWRRSACPSSCIASMWP